MKKNSIPLLVHQSMISQFQSCDIIIFVEIIVVNNFSEDFLTFAENFTFGISIQSWTCLRAHSFTAQAKSHPQRAYLFALSWLTIDQHKNDFLDLRSNTFLGKEITRSPRNLSPTTDPTTMHTCHAKLWCMTDVEEDVGEEDAWHMSQDILTCWKRRRWVRWRLWGKVPWGGV